MKMYGTVGSPDVIVCPKHLRPENTVEVLTTNPDPNLYILGHDGTWILLASYKEARESAILKKWPVAKQLEAIADFVAGKPEKMNQLAAYLEFVRNEFPKDNK